MRMRMRMRMTMRSKGVQTLADREEPEDRRA